MIQLNIHMTEQFSQTLKTFMRLRKIRSKSEAVRVAVFEGLERLINEPKVTDFKEWIGAALKKPQNPNPRFKSHADLWE